ncbi:hypothetical protein Ddye_019932 [Dipteronia dyeriana]|uniref:GDSL esterase/lipase n=1 Tax=Dipteronia dyeriana TaxID=168575 RepID=A0AAD9TZ02_9ROSI|nr:hypothetical protein Ddye_019932 [Dipteronia dyeriana]
MAILLEGLKSIVFQISTLYLLLDICSGKEFPAIFTFGDSSVDVGNNYYIETTARPTLPYGIDFGTGKAAAGRYTNGRTIPDIIGQELGFRNFSPPYLSPMATGDIILKGVNYASAGSGILNDTGKNQGDLIDLEAQITYFGKTKQDIMIRIGKTAATSLLRESLYIIAIGSNDVRDHIFGSNQTNSLYSDADFHMLISTFRSQLIRLYYLGARKIVVTSCSCIGYAPFVRSGLLKEFIVPINQISQYYNSRLKKLLTELTTSLPGSMYVYSDVYSSLENIIRNGKTYGFENVYSGCCHGIGIFNKKSQCPTECQVCNNRNKYLFWDTGHPSDAGYLIMANRFMDGGLNYMSPMNIRQLMKFPVN